jgi:hypothetical protein
MINAYIMCNSLQHNSQMFYKPGHAYKELFQFVIIFRYFQKVAQ